MPHAPDRTATFQHTRKRAGVTTYLNGLRVLPTAGAQLDSTVWGAADEQPHPLRADVSHLSPTWRGRNAPCRARGVTWVLSTSLFDFKSTHVGAVAVVPPGRPAFIARRAAQANAAAMRRARLLAKQRHHSP